MRLLSRTLLSLALPFALLSLAGGEEWNPTTVGLDGYFAEPVWGDDWTPPGPPASDRWVPEVGPWNYNGELQYYTDSSDNTVQQDGLLKMTATRTPNGGKDYTSARWSTKGKQSFKYGVFAARMRLPQGQGIWPSFRLFGDGPIYSEIDIMEMAGGSSADARTGFGNDKAYSSVVWYANEVGGAVYRASNAVTQSVAPAKFADDFHVFWCEWTENTITVGFDDKKQVLADVSQIAVLKDTSMYVVFSLAVGGIWPGAPDASTVFPQTLEVDWLRIWHKDGQPGAIGPITPTPIGPPSSIDSPEASQPPPSVEPTPANPPPTDPTPTDPTPTDPTPTDPTPTDPTPTNPTPTDPAPTDPTPTEGASTGSPPPEVITNNYPCNRCRYTFIPSLPALSLPPLNAGDQLMSADYTIVDEFNNAAKCNGDRVIVWNTTSQSWMETYEADDKTEKQYSNIVYATSGNRLNAANLQSSEANVRENLMAGSLIELQLYCQRSNGNLASCVQFWLGPASSVPAAVSKRPSCVPPMYDSGDTSGAGSTGGTPTSPGSTNPPPTGQDPNGDGTIVGASATHIAPCAVLAMLVAIAAHLIKF